VIYLRLSVIFILCGGYGVLCWILIGWAGLI
jgi:hypothetical protein